MGHFKKKLKGLKPCIKIWQIFTYLQIQLGTAKQNCYRISRKFGGKMMFRNIIVDFGGVVAVIVFSALLSKTFQKVKRTTFVSKTKFSF